MPCCRRFIAEPSVPSAYAIPPQSNKTPKQSPPIQQVHTARPNRLSRKAAVSKQLRRTLFLPAHPSPVGAGVFPGRTPQAGREARMHREICFHELKIKNPQGLQETLRIAPASSSSPVPQPSRERWSILRAGLLAHGSSYSPCLPIH